jgi:hypothetical protein
MPWDKSGNLHAGQARKVDEGNPDKVKKGEGIEFIIQPPS